ncbi:hypothetical protein Tco_0491648 [Tanacetum coccineum]
MNCKICLQALVLVDVNGIKENCLKLGAGDDLYALFVGILTMRPWNKVIDRAVNHLAIQGNASDHNHVAKWLGWSKWKKLTVPNPIFHEVMEEIKLPSVKSFIIIGRVSPEALIDRAGFGIERVWQRPRASNTWGH